MRKSLVVLAAAAAILSLPAGYAAADHIASPDAVQSRLSDAAAQRAQNAARVDAVLATPIAAQAAVSVGADLGRVRAGVATLSDAELGDLAARAALLQSDPVAGLTSDQRLLVTIALVLVIIVLVLAIV